MIQLPGQEYSYSYNYGDNSNGLYNPFNFQHIKEEPIHPEFYEITINNIVYKCKYEYMVKSMKEDKRNIVVFGHDIVFLNDKDFDYTQKNRKHLFK